MLFLLIFENYLGREAILKFVVIYIFVGAILSSLAALFDLESTMRFRVT